MKKSQIILFSSSLIILLIITIFILSLHNIDAPESTTPLNPGLALTPTPEPDQSNIPMETIEPTKHLTEGTTAETPLMTPVETHASSYSASQYPTKTSTVKPTVSATKKITLTPFQTKKPTVKPTIKPTSTPEPSKLKPQPTVNPDDWEYISPDVPRVLYEYPYPNGVFMTGKEFLNKSVVNRDEVLDTAINFMELGSTVDYRTIGKEYKDKILYYYGVSSGKVKEIDDWIEEIKDEKVIQVAKFVSDKSLIYNDKDRIIVRGRLLVKLLEGSNSYMQGEGIRKKNIWYYQDVEVIVGAYSNSSLIYDIPTAMYTSGGFNILPDNNMGYKPL